MSTPFIKLFITTSLISLLSTFSHAEVVDEIEKSFAVNHQASFQLDNVNGSLAVKAWNKPTIKVTATITADNQADRDNIMVNMQQTPNGVITETRYKEQGSWGRNSHQNSAKVDYLVMVPANSSLSAIDLVNGAFSVENVKGEVQAKLVNGAIKAKGLASNSELSTVNGSIKVSYSELANDLNRIDVETVNGSIKVSVPKALNASVEAETMHGSIKTDFGLTVKKSFLGGSHLSGDIGRGDVSITMTSVNGSVKLFSH
jgi:hypothetical protein